MLDRGCNFYFVTFNSILIGDVMHVYALIQKKPLQLEVDLCSS